MGKAPVLRLNLPASLEYLEMLRMSAGELLKRLAAPPDAAVIYQVQLVASEVYANIIEHACKYNARQRVMIEFQIDVDCSLVMEFRDVGDSFAPDTIPVPDIENSPERGLGLHIIRQIVDEMRYTTHEDYNEWRLVKKLHHSG